MVGSVVNCEVDSDVDSEVNCQHCYQPHFHSHY